MAIIEFSSSSNLFAFLFHRTAIEEVNFALANLHSLAKHSMEPEPQALEEENYVLLDDDLVDDDDFS